MLHTLGMVQRRSNISVGALPAERAAVGRHTYGYTEHTFQIFTPFARVEVGAFCSIGPEVRILAGSEHIMTRPTTFPLDALIFDPAAGNASDVVDKGTTVIGNDVWIGLGAVILSGVLVGDGAVIGAGAVVSRWVPPYAVVAGNPAEIVRYRFSPQIRRRLQALSWWDWDDEQIRALRDWFVADVEAFLDEAERTHATVVASDLMQRLQQAPPEFVTRHRDSRGVSEASQATGISRGDESPS